ncbi:hypothetical protein ACS0PU_005644, partial [Formica fusca]
MYRANIDSRSVRFVAKWS